MTFLKFILILNIERSSWIVLSDLARENDIVPSNTGKDHLEYIRNNQ